LPGSRKGEQRRHAPILREAYLLLRRRRPRLRAVVGAADAPGEKLLRSAFADVPNLSIERGVLAAVADADAAWVASGTAVLETALCGVPQVLLYVIAPVLVRHARRVYSGPFIALPNLILQSEIIPEFLQDAATPESLCEAMEEILRDPARQSEALAGLRAALGPVDALQRSAHFAVALAQAAHQ
jgi:lipid-A-disaccharide synthase